MVLDQVEYISRAFSQDPQNAQNLYVHEGPHGPP
jgi:hypothetical protein